jgi:DNA-binding transcriptional LysR family regulator
MTDPALACFAVTDLRRLHYFLTVAQERNFTRAAERLHIAQPALSRQVRRLEQELGVELLYRTTHEFELTEAGRYLLERGPALLGASEELWRSVRSFGSGERGALIVAYGPSVSYETAPKLLTALAARCPEIALSTDVRPTAEVLAAVAAGSVDVGLVRCPPRTSELETWTIRLEPLGVLMLRRHPLAAESSVDLADLADETLLMHRREKNPGHYDALLALCRQRDVEPRIQLRALSFDPAQTPLVCGEAVTITGESSQVGLPTELVWLPIRPPAQLEVGLVARRYGRPPALDSLLEAATPVAAELGWLRRHAAAS